MPLPWPVLASLACALVRNEAPIMALAAVLASDAYLRPREVANLRVAHVVTAKPFLGKSALHTSLVLFPAEEGEPSKTLRYNDSVILDTADREWIGPLIEELAHRRRSEVGLFPFSQADMVQGVHQATASLGLTAWNITPYLFRHTGPSDDFVSKRRCLDAIKRRGRWASDASVRRYEKGSRVNARLMELTKEMLRHCHQCDLNLEKVLRGIVPPPPLPTSNPFRGSRATTS